MDRKLDRHEAFGGVSHRQKSKRLGLWVMLCHDPCHCGASGVHQNVNERLYLKRYAQRIAMNHFGWSEDDFIREFAKNYLI